MNQIDKIYWPKSTKPNLLNQIHPTNSTIQILPYNRQTLFTPLTPVPCHHHYAGFHTKLNVVDILYNEHTQNVHIHTCLYYSPNPGCVILSLCTMMPFRANLHHAASWLAIQAIDVRKFFDSTVQYAQPGWLFQSTIFCILSTSEEPENTALITKTLESRSAQHSIAPSMFNNRIILHNHMLLHV